MAMVIMTFLDEFRALDGESAQQTELLRRWLRLQPRQLFDEVRDVYPILSLPGIALVTRYTDVVEVLARDGDFSVAAYASKMQRATGTFFLGMDDGLPYEREVAIMRLASSRADLPILEQSIRQWADTCVRDHAHIGRLDAVSDVAQCVPRLLVAQYLGVPGPDAATLAHWLRALFWDIFLNPGDLDVDVRDEAARCSAKLVVWLDAFIVALIARNDAGEELPDSVLARLVQLRATPATALDVTGIRRNIAGLVVGAIDTTSECVANVLDFVLDRPQLLANACSLARDGTLLEMQAFVLEALRFNPQAPFLTRITRQPVTLARGTSRETSLPVGTVVLAATMSAMSDASELDAPETFMPGRPGRHYLHFGHGMHQCFGRHINYLQIAIIAQSVLRLPGLRRAPGDDGVMKYVGPFPSRLFVEFDPIPKGPEQRAQQSLLSS